MFLFCRKINAPMGERMLNLILSSGILMDYLFLCVKATVLTAWIKDREGNVKLTSLYVK